MSQKNDHQVMVFDFGNVLIDWNPHYLYRKLFDGDDAAVARFLEEIDFVNWNNWQDAGRPWEEAVALHCEQFPQYCELIQAYNDRWEESLGGPIWGTVRILEQLKARHFPMYGLSNWSAEKFKLIRETYEFFEWFDGIVISGEVKLIKPDTRIFEVLLERVGRPAGDCLLIDDSAANVATAKQLGFDTIRFESPVQLTAELGRRGMVIE